MVVKDGVILQGSVDKQVFFVGSDGVKHHISEEVGVFSELVDIALEDPLEPAVSTDTVQDHSSHLNSKNSTAP
ncbi:MAG: hypothetical protein AB1497_11245 [Bacillota bacterium]